MARYQVILSYDGTDFAGYQRQRISATGVGARTVQGVVEAALRQLGWQGRSILSAGRTDTGVHAAGQVIAFDLDWGHSPEALVAAINAGLPADVAARSAALAAATFHPRFDATARRYRYRLFHAEVRDPLQERFAWRVPQPVDLNHLRQAASLLTGTHDFAAFGTPPRTNGSTVRTVFSADWQQSGASAFCFEIVANAFLYHMVRRLVFTQLRVGQGGDLAEFQAGVQRAGAQRPGMAPPNGLTLVEVLYETVPGQPELGGAGVTGNDRTLN